MDFLLVHWTAGSKLNEANFPLKSLLANQFWVATRVLFDIATVVVYTFDCLAFGLSSTWCSLKSLLLNNELFSGWLVYCGHLKIRTVRNCTFHLNAGLKLFEAIYIWSQLACIRKTGCDKNFTACFHAEMRIFRTSY